MDKMLVFLAASVGSAVGWALGAMVSLFLAIFLGAVGTGAGIYFARRLRQDYF